MQLPVGLKHDLYGHVQKDPNLEVQNFIHLVFSTFLKLKSAYRTLRYITEHHLQIPRYDRFGELYWKKPTAPAITALLKNPAYAGAFAYGRTQMIPKGASLTDKAVKTLAQSEWKVLIQNKYPAYITWDIYEEIQRILKENYAEYERNQTRGIARKGTALLSGLVYCGECGHKMFVQYNRGIFYRCNTLQKKYGAPNCQTIPICPIEHEVTQAFLARFRQ